MKEKDLFICTSCFIVRADDVFLIERRACDVIITFKDEKKQPLVFTFEIEEFAYNILQQAIGWLD